MKYEQRLNDCTQARSHGKWLMRLCLVLTIDVETLQPRETPKIGAQMSNGTKTYAFKPALRKRKQSYFITKNQIELANKDGSDTVLRFKDITSLRYADTKAQGHKFRRLDISYGNNEMMRIGITLAAVSTGKNDKDLTTFYQLIHSIADNISQARPDLSVTVGESKRINWLYFAIGALTMLFAVGILLGAYLSGVSDKKLMNALFPIIAMAGFGAYICIMARSWATRTPIGMANP